MAEHAIRHGAGNASHLPVQVYLQIASACNLSCYMCSEHNRPEGARNGIALTSLSPEIFARIESEIFPWSSQLFIGVGGEPTFSEHFIDYVTRAGAANQEITLITNGTYLESSSVARAIAENVTAIQVSVDAATEATYERIRTGSRWTRLVEGIKKLQVHRAESSHPSQLTLTMVLMRSNIRELPDFIDLASSLDADSVHAQHVIPMTQESRQEPLLAEPALYDDLREEAIERARRSGIKLHLPAAFAGGSRAHCSVQTDPSLAGYAVPCRDPYQALVVLHDGRVFACCHPLAHEKMQVGDLAVHSIEEVWNGQLFRNLRAGLRSGEVPDVCQKCSIVNSPPPVVEDARALTNSPGIEEYYSSRKTKDAARTGVLKYVEDLRQHADTLEGERDDLRLDTANLRRHADALESERDGLLVYSKDLRLDTVNLRRHADALESERLEMQRHIENLEALGPVALFRRLCQSCRDRLGAASGRKNSGRGNHG